MKSAVLAPRSERGVILLTLLIVIAAMGAALASTATVWQQVQVRAKEEDLLFVGNQYRNAIRHYYESSPGPVKNFPPTLAALLRDDRVPSVRRYLRRPYRDPLTNSTIWGLILAPDGGISGVYSLAPGRPQKRANFPAEFGWAAGTAKYADWQFAYLPPNLGN